MIESQNIKDDDLRILIKLASVDIPFYPCGSRYFGYFTKDSDYDFFCSDTILVADLMLYLGFQILCRPLQYNDVNTLETYYKGNINIMTVRFVHARLEVQKLIYGTSDRPPKGDTDWWNKKYCELYPNLFHMPEISK